MKRKEDNNSQRKDALLNGRRRGEFDPEGAALVGLGEDAEAAVHEFDGAFDDGEADAGAGVFVAAMEFLEHAEHALYEFGADADAVVGDGNANERGSGRMGGGMSGLIDGWTGG